MKQLYHNFLNSDNEFIRSIQLEFENILGLKIKNEIFNRMYIHARYLPEFFTFQSNIMKPLYLKSQGRLALASKYLFQQFSSNTTVNDKLIDKYKPLIKNLSTKGYFVDNNFLNDKQIDRIKKELNEFDYYGPYREKTYKIKELKESNNERNNRKYSSFYSEFSDTDISVDSQIGKLIINSYMADIASTYFKSQSYLVRIVAIYTTPKEEKYFSDKEIHGYAQNWHIDPTSFGSLKFFIYLNDVKHENGPHTYLSGTHEDGLKYYPNKIEDFYKPGFKIYDNGMMDGYIKDSWVNNKYDSKRIVSHVAPKGTLIIENTSGFHRGSICTSGKREVLQFVYSISNCYPKNKQPNLDYSSKSLSKRHLAPIINSLKKEQIKKTKAFDRDYTLKNRIKNSIRKIVNIEK